MRRPICFQKQVFSDIVIAISLKCYHFVRLFVENVTVTTEKSTSSEISKQDATNERRPISTQTAGVTGKSTLQPVIELCRFA